MTHRHHHSGRRKARRRPPPGASPGTMSVDPTAPAPAIRVMGYGPEGLTEEAVREPEKIGEFLRQWPVTWVDVSGLGDAGIIQRIGEVFGIHRLALADVVNVHQRAKVEDYPDHLFIVSRMVTMKERGLDSEQFSLFLGKNYLLTFQERPGDCLEPVRERIRRTTGRIREAGADYLAYALLDAVVDGYFPVLERFGEEIEQLEDRVIARPDNAAISRIHEIRRELLAIRRAVWPEREAISVLMRNETPLVQEETRVYLRDCYDHSVQIIDLLENYREIASGLMDFYLSSVSNRMNEVMKVLAIFATIFIPLTFIAGVYGMNFERMPELHWWFGYPLALSVMAAVAAVMLGYFRRKGWMGSGPGERKAGGSGARGPAESSGEEGGPEAGR